MSQEVKQPNTDSALQLYMMEYKTCADRYENIYRSIWNIFSYLAVLAGGILTFKNDFEGMVIAGLVLTFWFLSTFEPLDRYANKSAHRLRAIEQLLNKSFNVSLKHYTEFVESRMSEGKGKPEIKRRTRRIVRIFFWPISVLSIVASAYLLIDRFSGVNLPMIGSQGGSIEINITTDTLDSQMISISRDDFAALLNRIKDSDQIISIESSRPSSIILKIINQDELNNLVKEKLESK